MRTAHTRTRLRRTTGSPRLYRGETENFVQLPGEQHPSLLYHPISSNPPKHQNSLATPPNLTKPKTSSNTKHLSQTSSPPLIEALIKLSFPHFHPSHLSLSPIPPTPITQYATHLTFSPTMSSLSPTCNRSWESVDPSRLEKATKDKEGIAESEHTNHTWSEILLSPEGGMKAPHLKEEGVGLSLHFPHSLVLCDAVRVCRAMPLQIGRAHV